MLLREKLRPYRTLKLYGQLVESLNKRIEQLNTICAQHSEIAALNEKRIEFLNELVKRQGDTIRDLRKQESEPLKMPLPTVEAVEGLCAAFFDAESVIIAREALDLTRNLAPVGPQDVKATNLCLMKLWRFYAMRKVEQAAKSDAL